MICDARCKSWACPRCGPSYWAGVRRKVQPYLPLFRKPGMLTLTLDRERFPSPEAAYEHARGYIRRLLDLMGLDKAFVVLAFHPKAPEWAHWHLLIDLDDCGGFLDFKRMWHLWRDKWGCGRFDVSPPKGRDAVAAAGYILGYAQHQAGVVADWVIERTRVPRAYEVYGSLREAMRGGTPPPAPDDAEPADEEAVCDASPDSEAVPDFAADIAADALLPTVGDRIRNCGDGAVVLRRSAWYDGSVHYKYVGSLPWPSGVLAQLHVYGELPRLGVESRVRTFGDGQGGCRKEREVAIPLGRTDDPRDVLERVERAVMNALGKPQYAAWKKPIAAVDTFQ